MTHINRQHDPELGAVGFLLPKPKSPNESRNSSGSDCGESRLGDKSTDQSSLDPEQPSKPLIVEKYMINNDETHRDCNGIYNSSSSNNNKCKSTETLSTKSSKKRKLLRAKICCILGTVMFCVGLTLLLISVFFIQCSPDKSDERLQPDLGELVNTDENGTVRSLVSTFTQSSSTTSTSVTPSTTTISFADLVNLAKDKRAFQSTTYSDSAGNIFPAMKAVDDNFDDSFSAGACAQTKEESSPIWWVDLESYKLVKRVRITKPRDCCDTELSNFEVRIGQQREVNTNILCQRHGGTANSRVTDIVCRKPIYGRYVSIQLLPERHSQFKDVSLRKLTLCEVAMYSR